jgi:hypothetical protein
MVSLRPYLNTRHIPKNSHLDRSRRTVSSSTAQWRGPRISHLLLLLPVLFHLTLKTRHFDRSCSRFCEQRSGETCFSTHTFLYPSFAVVFAVTRSKSVPLSKNRCLSSLPGRKPVLISLYPPYHRYAFLREYLRRSRSPSRNQPTQPIPTVLPTKSLLHPESSRKE